MKYKGRSEIITALLFTAIGIGLIFKIIPDQVASGSGTIPNARTFPYLAACAFTLLSALWTIGAGWNLRKHQRAGKDCGLLLGLIVSMSIVALTALIDWSGYLLGGTISVVAVFVTVEGMRKWPRKVAISIILVALFALFFENVLNIEIPVGILGFSIL